MSPQDMEPSFKKPFVLIIEDEQFLCKLLVKKFESSGFIVQQAFDGESGVKIMETQKPDALLLDLLLPGIDGFEVLRLMKINPRLNAIPVIVLSNLSEPKDIDRAKRGGAAAYLVKAETSPKSIVDAVQGFLQEKGGQNQWI